MGELILKKGDKQSAVAWLQNIINQKGDYNLELDGIFGDATEKAVRELQAKLGLMIDGIADVKTIQAIQMASDYVKPPDPTEAPIPTQPGHTYNPYTSTEEGKNKYQKIEDAETAIGEHGDFEYLHADWMEKVLSNIQNRDKFSYDFNEDALYQQYKDKYIKQGKMAMQDTIGQASAMTGGYGNSYAASVGNQAYQAHLENLNDVIPELYNMAYDRYKQEGQDLYNQYGLLLEDYKKAYGEHSDEYNKLVDAYNRAYSGFYDGANLYDTEQMRGIDVAQKNWENEFSIWDANNANAWEQKKFEESKRQYNEELAFRKQQYNDSKASNSGSSGSSSGGGSGSSNKNYSSGSKNNNTSSPNNTPTVSPKKSGKTDSFIGTHQTKDEFMARGDKTYKQFLEYIEGEIEKAEGDLSDEELLYLINYYGLS